MGEVSDQRWGNFNGCNVQLCRPKMAGVRKQTIRGEVKKKYVHSTTFDVFLYEI